MSQLSSVRPRVLTGDTPTGRLHLGHWLGSVKTRVELQATYDCYFIIANLHAFTTQPERGREIRDNTFNIALDYLSAGINPEKSTIFIQSEVPAIAELTYLLSMFLPFSRVMRNPTLKQELKSKGLKDHYSFGFALYPVGQVADILAFRPSRVPVGEDQLPHLEMTKEVARRFNQLYCTTSSTEEEVFPIIQSELVPAKRLVGIGPPNEHGVLPKMSKSLNNAIYLSDSNELIQQKIQLMYTDPKRIRATDKGTIVNNPLWEFHEAFNIDKVWVEEAKALYQQGKIGDIACKKKLSEVILELLEPMHQRRAQYESKPHVVWEILKEGTKRANRIASETLLLVKEKMHQLY